MSEASVQRAVAVVDVGAVERNCARLASELSEGGRLCAVVKADGYGHGAVECARAALAGGASWLAVAAAAEAAELREALPEAAILTMGALTEAELDLALRAGSDVAVWRPGFAELVAGRGEDAVELVGELVRRIEAPMVIDADGLNALAGELDALTGRPAPTVITPHAGELGRLLEIDSGEVNAQRLRCARDAARRSGAVVVLKGDDTIVVGSDGAPAINALSSPALATAGTGDVLSGMIAALLARGVEPRHAAAAAVHAHARAGRAAAESIGAAESVIATDVIAAIPRGLRL